MKLIFIIFASLVVGYAVWQYIRHKHRTRELPNLLYAFMAFKYPHESFLALVVKEINRLRRKDGAKPLKVDTLASMKAEVRALEVSVWGQFNHHKANLVIGELVNKGADGVAELLGRGHGTPKGLVKSWNNSPEHREEMLDKKYDYIGVGKCFVRELNFYAAILIDESQV